MFSYVQLLIDTKSSLDLSCGNLEYCTQNSCYIVYLQLLFCMIIVLYSILAFDNPDADCRYSHGFYLLRYLHVFYLFPVLGQILPFFVTNTDSTLFRYSPRQVFDTRTKSNFCWYTPGFYHLSVLTLIRPFPGIRRDSFFDTRTDSTFSRYSPRF